MDFTAEFFPGWFSWTTTVSMFAILALVLHTLRGSSHFQQRRVQHWLWSVFFLSVVWLMRVSLESGINMHLSGGMLMALMFGWRMGFAGLCLVNFTVCVFSDALFINLGSATLFNGLIPVSIAYLIFLLLEAWLPRHFFIYIYGSAFFGSWITSALAGLSIALCLAFFGVFEWSLLAGEFLPFNFLFGFGEAFLTSGLITLFVVYRPQWVYSFRDQRYLQDR